MSRAESPPGTRRTGKPSRVYGFDDYADDGILKIPFSLWLVIAYSARHLLLIVLGGVSAFSSRRGASVDTDYHSLFSHELMLAASIPAVLVVIAAFRRLPGAGRLPRAIWRRGAALLAAGGVADLSLIGYLSLARSQSFGLISLVWVILDCYVLVYLARSWRARDTFREFPVRAGDA